MILAQQLRLACNNTRSISQRSISQQLHHQHDGTHAEELPHIYMQSNLLCRQDCIAMKG